MSEKTTQEASRRAAEYWRANLKILGVLLGLWFVSGCVLSVLLVEPLNEVKVAGFPLGFWFAQQGTIYVFIVLILIYAILMERLDRKFESEEEK